MKICIPVVSDQGLQSRISGHFGSAPVFMVVDTETKAFEAITNANQHHEHGGCAPIAMLAQKMPDAVVVTGIGAGALAKLNSAGIPVYATQHGVVGEAMAAFTSGSLHKMEPHHACSHHHANGLH